MSDFKSDRSAATTPPAGAPAPCTLCRPPNGRAAPDDDLEPMSSATTACGSTKKERRTHATPPPRTRTERFRQRLQRRLGKAGAPRDRARATAAERLVLRPRHRHGILRRAWPRLAAAVCRPVDRFRGAPDARYPARRRAPRARARHPTPAGQCRPDRDGRRAHRQSARAPAAQMGPLLGTAQAPTPACSSDTPLASYVSPRRYRVTGETWSGWPRYGSGAEAPAHPEQVGRQAEETWTTAR